MGGEGRRGGSRPPPLPGAAAAGAGDGSGAPGSSPLPAGSAPSARRLPFPSSARSPSRPPSPRKAPEFTPAPLPLPGAPAPSGPGALGGPGSRLLPPAAAGGARREGPTSSPRHPPLPSPSCLGWGDPPRRSTPGNPSPPAPPRRAARPDRGREDGLRGQPRSWPRPRPRARSPPPLAYLDEAPRARRRGRSGPGARGEAWAPRVGKGPFMAPPAPPRDPAGGTEREGERESLSSPPPPLFSRRLSRSDPQYLEKVFEDVWEGGREFSAEKLNLPYSSGCIWDLSPLTAPQGTDMIFRTTLQLPKIPSSLPRCLPGCIALLRQKGEGNLNPRQTSTPRGRQERPVVPPPRSPFPSAMLNTRPPRKQGERRCHARMAQRP